jgi:hypothetical protein
MTLSRYRNSSLSGAIISPKLGAAIRLERDAVGGGNNEEPALEVGSLMVGTGRSVDQQAMTSSGSAAMSWGSKQLIYL